jgi:hypothetical protein
MGQTLPSVDPTPDAGNDTVLGTAAANALSGLGGSDIVAGLGGDDNLNGGTGSDLLLGGDGNDTLDGGNFPANFTITAAGEDLSTNNSYLQFRFLSGTGFIQSVSINLRGGGDGDAVFDDDNWAINANNFLGGLTSGDIASFPNPDGTGSLAITFDPSTFSAGRGFDLNIDVDNLTGSDDGEDFGTAGVTATVTLQDGSIQTVTFVTTNSTTSVATFGPNNEESDILSSGRGADTFAFQHTGNPDMIVDYSFVDGDKIDLSALLDAEFGGGDLVADFVRLQQSGSNVTVQVDVNGTDGGANWADVATLVGYGTSNADLVKVAFESADHTLTV